PVPTFCGGASARRRRRPHAVGVEPKPVSHRPCHRCVHRGGRTAVGVDGPTGAGAPGQRGSGRSVVLLRAATSASATSVRISAHRRGRRGNHSVTTTHDDTKAQQKPPRRLRSLGRAIDWWFDRIQAEYIRGAPPARATLAKLRRALGKPAGSVPEVWEHTIAVVPRSLSWDRDEPSP